MKKIILLVSALLIVVSMQAQQSMVVSSYTYLNNKQLPQAKEAIDAALVHDKTKNEEKTHRYAGNVYLEIHLTQHMGDGLKVGMTGDEVKALLREPVGRKKAKFDDGTKGQKWSYEYGMETLMSAEMILLEWKHEDIEIYKALSDNPLDIAYDEYQKSIELGVEGEDYAMVKFKLYICGEQFYNQGVTFFGNKDYVKAADAFDRTIKVNNIFSVKDSLATFNAGLSAELAKDADRAAGYYENLVKMNYRQPNIYSSLYNIYLAKGDTAKAGEIIALGRERYKDELNLLILETNLFLNTGEEEKAKQNLELAVEKDPTNPNLHFVIGTKYFDMLKEMEYEDDKALFDNTFNTAKQYLGNAIDLDPKYFEALYNLGALYVNEGVRIFNEANKITDMNEYSKYSEKYEAMWDKSIEYMERAVELRSDDYESLMTLKQLYARKNKMDKVKELQEMIDKLPK